MNTSLDNFRLWYSRVLSVLSKDGDAGFVILMTAFPLLERYLREKSGVHEGNLRRDLGQSFYTHLRVIFPALIDNVQAENFWQVYRNGILHHVTLSQQNQRGVRMPNGWLSGSADMITVDSLGDFWVHPAKFSQKVVEMIEADFGTFEGASSVNHPFPSIHTTGPHTSSVTPPIAPPGTGCAFPNPPAP
jgi:hypothetical protein